MSTACPVASVLRLSGESLAPLPFHTHTPTLTHAHTNAGPLETGREPRSTDKTEPAGCINGISNRPLDPTPPVSYTHDPMIDAPLSTQNWRSWWPSRRVPSRPCA